MPNDRHVNFKPAPLLRPLQQRPLKNSEILTTSNEAMQRNLKLFSPPTKRKSPPLCKDSPRPPHLFQADQKKEAASFPETSPHKTNSPRKNLKDPTLFERTPSKKTALVVAKGQLFECSLLPEVSFQGGHTEDESFFQGKVPSTVLPLSPPGG